MEIVSHGETDSLTGKIAYDSPVESNLMVHIVGNVSSLEVLTGITKYKII